LVYLEPRFCEKCEDANEIYVAMFVVEISMN